MDTISLSLACGLVLALPALALLLQWVVQRRPGTVLWALALGLAAAAFLARTFAPVYVLLADFLLLAGWTAAIPAIRHGLDSPFPRRTLMVAALTLLSTVIAGALAVPEPWYKATVSLGRTALVAEITMALLAARQALGPQWKPGFLAVPLVTMILSLAGMTLAIVLKTDLPGGPIILVVAAQAWVVLVLLFHHTGHLRALNTHMDTDELTGLKNRHSLEERQRAEMERARRYQQPLSLIMIDIDHFKQVNDQFGHACGDLALRALATCVSGQIREPDHVFRWGGEEFLILAPHTDREGARAMAEKLRLAAGALEIAGPGRITISCGVAQWQPEESLEAWFERVDQVLYQAKNRGRNQVVVWEEGQTLPVAKVRIQWRSDWESGNPVIDREHMHLLELANDILELSQDRNQEALLGERLGTLISHVVTHFGDEEAELAACAYPELEGHRRLHQALVKEALRVKAAFEAGNCTSGDFYSFLVGTVITGHMLSADTLFFPWTRSTAKGASALQA